MRYMILGASFWAISMVASAAGRSVDPAAFTPQTIYGDDDRVEPTDLESDHILSEYRHSIVALVPNSALRKTSGAFKLDAPNFADWTAERRAYHLCPDERFADQPVAAYCTGFLVAPDIVATAGHCLATPAECNGTAFIFDYAMDHAAGRSFDRSQVYKCDRVIKSISHDRDAHADFALLRLDRKVVGRMPLPLHQRGKLALHAAVGTLGHPQGMPLKLTVGPDTEVTKVFDSSMFQTNLDSVQGGSGSPIVNLKSGLVEGILASGDGPDWGVDECGIITRSCEFNSGDCIMGTLGSRSNQFASILDRLADLEGRREVQLMTESNVPLSGADAGDVEIPIPVGAGRVVAVALYLKMTHSYLFGLTVSLRHPDGTEVAVLVEEWPYQDSDAKAVDGYWGYRGWYTADLEKFAGKSMAGTWKVVIRDRYDESQGELRAVGLSFVR